MSRTLMTTSDKPSTRALQADAVRSTRSVTMPTASPAVSLSTHGRQDAALHEALTPGLPSLLWQLGTGLPAGNRPWLGWSAFQSASLVNELADVVPVA